MLDYTKKGTYKDAQNFTWVFYQDDINSSVFYVVPRPSWAQDSDGNPEIKLVEYSTEAPNTGSGYIVFNTQLSVPRKVEQEVETEIPAQFPSAAKPYQLKPLDYNPGSTAEFTLDVNGTATDYLAAASEFGSNVATFRADLDRDGMSTIKKLLLGTAGNGIVVTYDLSVPAPLNGVTATLEFDSSIAYRYQVQYPQHRTYGAATQRVVNRLLKESNSWNVDLHWHIQNPSSYLVAIVTNWAKNMISELVSDEVTTALSLLKEGSYESFNINQVHSFKSVYSSNQVVNWKLYSKATLPAVKSLANYSSEINERKQVMTISAHLPFKDDGVEGPSVSRIDSTPASIRQLTARVKYSGLSNTNSTYVFTSNGAHTFSAPYDTQTGDAFDIAWTAEYADGRESPVSGRASKVTNGQYVISLSCIGFLSVTFDALPAFAALKPANGATTPPPVVTSIDIDFHFADSNGAGKAVHLIKTVEAPPAEISAFSQAGEAAAESTRAVFTSFVAHRVVFGTPYSYVVTYHFKEGDDFVGAEKSGTGRNQTIPAPPAPHPIPLVIVARITNRTPAGDPVPTTAQAKVDVWFDSNLTLPGTAPQPTKTNPTRFNLVAKTTEGVVFARKIFYGYLNGDAPLVYSALIDTTKGGLRSSVNITPTLIENHQASILLNPEIRYMTITVLMNEVDWATNGCDKITLDVIATGKDKNGRGLTIESPHRFLTYSPPPAKGPAHNPPRYLTWEHPAGATIDFTWEASYIESGIGHTSASGKGDSSNPKIIVPAKGTGNMIAPPVPGEVLIIT